jgi:hypothetical protein
MSHDSLREYFGKLLKREGYISSQSMAVFGQLIRLTVAFRDEWKAEHNEILTVDETKEALDLYLQALDSKEVPRQPNDKIDQLVGLWLREINGKSY